MDIQCWRLALAVWCRSSPAGCVPWREDHRQDVAPAAVNSLTTTSA